MTILKGEIYWADLNPAIGSETSKIRPAVVSNDIGNRFSSTITILPITSQTEKIYPYEVVLKAGEAGMKSDSKVKANQIRTIDKSRLKERIGKLRDAKMQEIENAILIHLGIRR
jgi:mRNA interferase MazF